MRHRLIGIAAFGLLAGLLCSPPALAHWCSNIYQTFARIVVKPERSNLDVAVGQTGELKVRVRNNFPYSLRYLQLRVEAPDELEVTVSPDEQTAAGQPVVAGQEITFNLRITRLAEGPDDLATLGLQVNTSVEAIAPQWRTGADQWIDPSPDPQALYEHQDLGLHQARALTWAKLAELGCAGCERDGLAGLQELWASRLDPCNPDGFDSPWPMQFIRAGQQLAIRLRFSQFVEVDRAALVQTMIAAMDDAHDIARGYAALLAAYGGDDPGVQARIQSMADSDPAGACPHAANPRAQTMARAALLLLGQEQHRAEVSACVGDSSQNRRVRSACAAVLGMLGEDAPIVDYLLGQVPDGGDTSYDQLFASYLLQLVVHVRRGGPAATGGVSFLGEEAYEDPGDPYGGPDPEGSGCGCAQAGSGGRLILAGWLVGWLLIDRRRRRPARGRPDPQ